MAFDLSDLWFVTERDLVLVPYKYISEVRVIFQRLQNRNHNQIVLNSAKLTINLW